MPRTPAYRPTDAEMARRVDLMLARIYEPRAVLISWVKDEFGLGSGAADNLIARARKAAAAVFAERRETALAETVSLLDKIIYREPVHRDRYKALRERSKLLGLYPAKRVDKRVVTVTAPYRDPIASLADPDLRRRALALEAEIQNASQLCLPTPAVTVADAPLPTTETHNHSQCEEAG